MTPILLPISSNVANAILFLLLLLLQYITSDVAGRTLSSALSQRRLSANKPITLRHHRLPLLGDGVLSSPHGAAIVAYRLALLALVLAIEYAVNGESRDAFDAATVTRVGPGGAAGSVVDRFRAVFPVDGECQRLEGERRVWYQIMFPEEGAEKIAALRGNNVVRSVGGEFDEAWSASSLVSARMSRQLSRDFGPIVNFDPGEDFDDGGGLLGPLDEGILTGAAFPGFDESAPADSSTVAKESDSSPSESPDTDGDAEDEDPVSASGGAEEEGEGRTDDAICAEAASTKNVSIFYEYNNFLSRSLPSVPTGRLGNLTAISLNASTSHRQWGSMAEKNSEVARCESLNQSYTTAATKCVVFGVEKNSMRAMAAITVSSLVVNSEDVVVPRAIFFPVNLTAVESEFPEHVLDFFLATGVADAGVLTLMEFSGVEKNVQILRVVGKRDVTVVQIWGIAIFCLLLLLAGVSMWFCVSAARTKMFQANDYQALASLLFHLPLDTSISLPITAEKTSELFLSRSKRSDAPVLSLDQQQHIIQIPEVEV